ncbi:hypothetical protein AGOR_G00018960 [Albula goreensis]|uniref:Uncharacterized protein n=1 Tax=Albula goreensis TaxID=1534307 RepID=A0A8T3E415_9TELE|nr:hypothetical protein AGOR_G00018960 [Albula goreensis]
MICDSEDSFSHTPSSQQPSPAISAHTPRISSLDFTTDGMEESRSESESSLPLDYLFLSQCETGRVSSTRCNSCSNSERSLEQTSSDNTFEDVFPSPLCTNPIFSPFLPPGALDPPQCSLRLYPPGPTIRFSERRPEESCVCLTPRGGEGLFAGQPAPIPRRISLAGLDHVRRGEFESSSVRSLNKRLSHTLSCPVTIPSASLTDSYEDSYVPMSSGASTPAAVSDITSDGYIPMSPPSAKFLTTNGKAETAPPPTPPRGLPADLEPPPVNRDLKPRRRARPPPLDLRGLSTIRECPTHLPLTRTLTEPINPLHCFLLERRRMTGGTPGGQDDSSISTDRQLFFPMSASGAWPRRLNLDYLSLDFNSASPSPVQKKPFLADEHRVDYVQVDEKKTQALQNTKMEWKDVRQSKV